MNDEQNIIIYRTADGRASVALYAKDGKIWLNQQQMAELFATSKPNISMHIANILKERELNEISVVKNYLTTAADGKNYNVVFYSLEMIIAVGYRVRGIRGTQFRQWATEHLTEYLIKGFTMDDERLKNPDGRPDYFDELLARIRDIRTSEKRFYQKVRDLFALSSDYDKTDKATQMFFAETQNKLLYAVTHQTAAELIVARADAKKPNMGLTTWKGSIVRKGDIIIAKNYLEGDEIDSLNHLIDIFLTSAEERVKSRRDLAGKPPRKPRVLNNESVRAKSVRLRDKSLRPGQLRVRQQNVDGHVDAHPANVGIPDPGFKVFEGEVFSSCPCAEFPEAQVYFVCSVLDCGHKAFRAAGGCQKMCHKKLRNSAVRRGAKSSVVRRTSDRRNCAAAHCLPRRE